MRGMYVKKMQIQSSVENQVTAQDSKMSVMRVSYTITCFVPVVGQTIPMALVFLRLAITALILIDAVRVS